MTPLPEAHAEYFLFFLNEQEAEAPTAKSLFLADERMRKETALQRP
jgi:hypothetical protein